MIGVPVGRIMSTAREISFTFTPAAPAEGVLPPSIGTPRISIPSTPLSPASWVVQPPAPTSLVGASGGMVTGIPSVPIVPTSFTQTAQSGPIGSSAFFQGFPWNGGNIPPSTPYVGPTHSYVGIQFGNTNPYGQGFQTSVSAPFMSSPFSLFSGGIPSTVFQTQTLIAVARTSYTSPHINNPLAYGWNPFQSIPTTSQMAAWGNPAFTYGNTG